VKSNGPCYAHAYKALAEGGDADLFVIFGTGHQLAQPPFVMTEKDYQTPLGAAARPRAHPPGRAPALQPFREGRPLPPQGALD